MKLVTLLYLSFLILEGCEAAVQQAHHIQRAARINRLERSFMAFHDRSRQAFLAGDHALADYYDQRCMILWNLIAHFRSFGPTLSSGAPIEVAREL